jgi:hypothetical protein
MALTSRHVLRGANAAWNDGPHSVAYTDADQYPLYQAWNYAHENIYQSWDSYFSGSSWTSSSVNGNFNTQKSGGSFYFNSKAGITPGTNFTWDQIGAIDLATGKFQWNRQIKTTDTTASSSTSTGALVSAGGVGVAGAVNAGGPINTTDTTVSSSATTGAIVAAGGAGIAGAINAGGAIKTTDATVSSSTATGALVIAGGAGVAGKAFIGGNTVVGAAQTVAVENMLTLRGADSSATGPHYSAYTATNQYPLFQNLNYAHDFVGLNFDMYYDGTWRSANVNSGYQIYKTTNQLQFNYTSGVAAGSALSLGSTWNIAGYIDTAGILQWQRAIKTAATTASSSASTGSIVAAGGAGIAGAINAGGAIATTDATVSSSTATGALVVAGGAGIAGAINAGGAIKTTNTTVSSSTATGALISAGGAGIAGAINAGGAIKTTDTTVSSSTATGALIVAGGAGITGAVNCGTVTSNTNSVPVWRYSYTNTTVGFSTTTAETSIIAGTSIGSLVFAAPTAAGLTVKIFNSWLMTFGAATTFTIRLKVNGTTVNTTTMAAGTVVNQFVHCDFTLQLRTPSNRLYSTSKVTRDGGTTAIFGTIIDSIWAPASANTLSMTGQFSDTNGSWRGDCFDVWSSHSS